MLTNLLYIDPAATSILLTSISAIVVAVGATFVIIWNKMKKKVCKTLHIDENAHKEVEDDIVITDDEVKDEVAVADDKAEEPAKDEE
jgi:hypothetical protein